MSLKLKCEHVMMMLLLGIALAAAPAFAEKPAHAGKGAAKQADKSSGGGSDSSVTINAYFGERERSVVRDYYADEFRAGQCPPGLAKKNNGCMPPGQAKKWKIGHRLPGDVVYYDLPAGVVVRLGAPPAGHRYIRVAADILLIAVGTGMVVDAIEDLSRM